MGSGSAVLFRRVRIWKRGTRCFAIVLSCIVLASSGAGANEKSALLFGGFGVTNGWQDVFKDPASLEFTIDGLLGIGVAREWQTQVRGVSVGVEALLSYHTGGQTYVELGAPAVVRYAPDWRVPINSFAYGLGLSWTSDISDLEVEKGGDSQKTLFYWMVEAEFPLPSDDWSGLWRLHHRSNGFDTFDAPGSSNFITLGIRRAY